MVDTVKIRAADGTVFDVAGDVIDGVFHPSYKIAYGPEDSQTPVDADNPLPTTNTTIELLNTNIEQLNDNLLYSIREQKLTNKYLSLLIGDNLREEDSDYDN